MAVQPPVEYAPKTAGESVVCFGCCAALILAAALGVQWLLSLIP